MIFDLKEIRYNELSIRVNKSKSLFIRYLISHFIQYGITLPVEDNDADDVKIVHQALLVIQKQTQQTSSEISIIDVKDCGAAYRFLLALLAVTRGEWFLTGTERLLKRPILSLIESLESIGASIVRTEKGLRISGKELSTPNIHVDCRESSQFASALLLIGKRIGLQNLNISPLNPPSKPYIKMTRSLIEEVEQNDSLFSIHQIEGDWSSAAFWYAFVALQEKCTCKLPGLKYKNSLQGDCIIAEWMKDFGIITEEDKDGVVIKNESYANKIPSLRFDITNHPDLAPILCCMAVLKKCKMTLTGIQNLNLKESRRLDIIVNELSKFADLNIQQNQLIIETYKKVSGEKLFFKTHNDHRFVMAFMLFALQNEIELDDVSPVSKSYPDFLREIEKLK